MREIIRLRFAMEVWSVTFQNLLIGPQSPSPYLLAKQAAQDCRLLLDDFASVHQVACSKMGQLGVFRPYVKFDFPPDPHVARKVLARICVENNALHYTISDPLNYVHCESSKGGTIMLCTLPTCTVCAICASKQYSVNKSLLMLAT